MKERGIIFSAPMVRAILEGRKTQTRRIVKTQPVWTGRNWTWGSVTWADGVDNPFPDYCPHGKPGDRLWVREGTVIHASIREQLVGYMADGCKVSEAWEKGMSPMYMRRAHSRITLDIAAVRVQRLVEISEDDCLEEGITDHDRSPHTVYTFSHYSAAEIKAICEQGRPVSYEDSAQDAYRKLWESINGPGSWEANPWVWATTFERVEVPA